MIRCLLLIVAIFVMQSLNGQSQPTQSQNTADVLLESPGNLNIGGYGQVDYNQPIEGGEFANGTLDVHRLVLLFGYKFNSKASFVTEVEFEHVQEVFIEQAFLNYRFNQYLQLRAGLLLIPMGIVNEYHEPPTFNGVERPNLDKIIIPTTWREIGAGFTGRIDQLSIRYQAYLVNGLNGFDGNAKFDGANGIRNGRQKGAESFSSAPNFTGKIEYYGISSLKMGLSGYFGDSQSTAFDGISRNNDLAVNRADSSVVGISMIGLDARYNINGFQFRGQYNHLFLSNTDEYNQFTGSDVGSRLSGFYLEMGYDLFNNNQNITSQLIPFFRYETYNTHQSVESNLEENENYKRTELTAGIGWKITPGAMLKLDYQWLKSGSSDYKNQLNAGVAIWFF